MSIIVCICLTSCWVPCITMLQLDWSWSFTSNASFFCCTIIWMSCLSYKIFVSCSTIMWSSLLLSSNNIAHWASNSSICSFRVQYFWSSSWFHYNRLISLLIFSIVSNYYSTMCLLYLQLVQLLFLGLQ